MPMEIRPAVDILSIGSLQKVEYQDAQKRTFGSAPYVRNFLRINELNDTEISCYTNLTTSQLELIYSDCEVMEHRTYFGNMISFCVVVICTCKPVSVGI